VPDGAGAAGRQLPDEREGDTMRQHDPSDERLPAIGHPTQEPENAGDRTADFAEEHDTTAVDEDITSGRDKEREEESPHGWSGLQS